MHIELKQVVLHEDKVLGLSTCGQLYLLTEIGHDTYAWKLVRFIKAETKTESDKTE